ncbi:ankyrin repeat-containing BDA1-like [Olea europaea subsp. europaea]|uniref:Ankyrin repeat-containing BDA1-like n=1 Tax=Olea europaea subsp. europaea TaxID=158383 RepID=A0A8S0SR50_OLEEU|nr:ankyrin repeat-containing BDA1-like [Olea europaea subsp. europaea]
MDTAQHPDIVALYNTISTNPHYLEVPNEMPFAQTPLHIAACEGRTDLALEILRLKPSLGKKLNLDDLSPLHLALHNEHVALHNEHASAAEQIGNHDPSLIRVPGRGGITPLHYVVETENIDFLIKFLMECPSAIKDFTIRDETAVHIAVRKGKFRAFKFLELLIGKVKVNDKNMEGKTALDILESGNENARQILMRAGSKHRTSLVKGATTEEYLSSRMLFSEMLIKLGVHMQLGLSGSTRNAILVVAVLIATASYQATLTPPHDEKIIPIYTIINTVIFSMAFGTCAILIYFVPWYLYLFISLSFFMVSYQILALSNMSYNLVFFIVSLLISIIWPLIIISPGYWTQLAFLGRRHSADSLNDVKYIVFTSRYAKWDD